MKLDFPDSGAGFRLACRTGLRSGFRTGFQLAMPDPDSWFFPRSSDPETWKSEIIDFPFATDSSSQSPANHHYSQLHLSIFSQDKKCLKAIHCVFSLFLSSDIHCVCYGRHSCFNIRNTSLSDYLLAHYFPFKHCEYWNINISFVFILF